MYQISPANAKWLEKKWLGTQDQTARDDLRKSIEMRISAVEQGMSRATDLLIDGALDNETYLNKKKEATLTIASLRDNLRKLPDPAEIETNTRYDPSDFGDWDACVKAAAAGRTTLLAHLKDAGISKLPERQKIATAFAKASREGRL